MTPEAAFIDDILADPTDPTSALIYADWLDDQGRSSEALQVRFCAQSGMQPGRSRQETLAWWDPIQVRWLGRLAVGKIWLLEVWGWPQTPEQTQVVYLSSSGRGG